jgi:hypothetical protein
MDSALSICSARNCRMALWVCRMVIALLGTKFWRGIGVGKMGCSDAYKRSARVVIVHDLDEQGQAYHGVRRT